MERKLTDRELGALRDRATELDIHSGGHCDLRLGCVNFWSSPDNCPEGQEHLRYLKGAIGYPRNFIGSVYFADLTVDTFNYERARQETGKMLVRGDARRPYENALGDVAWVREQWRALWQAAMPGAIVPGISVREGRHNE